MSKRKLDANAVDGSGEEEGTKNEILNNQQFKRGDLTWVEIHESSWWPAQVVDEGYVSAKPTKKFKGELLVRLYGSYEYVYVDASKSNSEFEDILKRENKTMNEKFMESLEKDMSLMLSKEQSQLSLKPDVCKDGKQKCELTKTIKNEADFVAMDRKVCTNKEKTEGSNKRKQKCGSSKEENEELLPMASNTKNPNIKKQKKVSRKLEFRNHDDSLILMQSPCENQEEMEAPIYENQEELKAKDLEIRNIVIDIIFGELNNNPPRTQSNAENMAAKLSTGLKGKSNRNDKINNNEAQKRNISDSKLVEKKVVKVYQRAKVKHAAAESPLMAEREERGPLSERQVRVMQNLALIAPSGSPFGRTII